ncbi:hypothetical protein Tco_0712881 [Tanacetum coccineum]
MTRNTNTKIFTPSTNPERQFRARKDTSPISVHNIYSFYESEQSDAESEEIGEVDIETLTMEQYLALDHGDTRKGVRKPEIEGQMDIEIKNNVHAIKGRYESGDEMYYHASEKVKCVQATKYKEDSLMMKPGNNSPSGNNSKVEETLGKYLEESCKRHDIFDELMKRFKENINKNLRKHDSAIKGLEENVTRLAQAVKTHNKINQDKALDIKSSIIISPLSVNSNVVHGTNSIGQEIIKKIGEKDGVPWETPSKEPRIFIKNVRKRIKKE